MPIGRVQWWIVRHFHPRPYQELLTKAALLASFDFNQPAIVCPHICVSSSCAKCMADRDVLLTLWIPSSSQDRYDSGMLKGQRFGYAVDLVWCGTPFLHLFPLYSTFQQR